MGTSGPEPAWRVAVVIDDNEAQRDSGVIRLRAEGLQAKGLTFEEALVYDAWDQVDLVVLDIHDGRSTAARAEALQKMSQRTDVEVDLPGYERLAGVRVLRRIQRSGAAPRRVVISSVMQYDSPATQRVLELGVDGFDNALSAWTEPGRWVDVVLDRRAPETRPAPRSWTDHPPWNGRFLRLSRRPLDQSLISAESEGIMPLMLGEPAGQQPGRTQVERAVHSLLGNVGAAFTDTIDTRSRRSRVPGTRKFGRRDTFWLFFQHLFGWDLPNADQSLRQTGSAPSEGPGQG